MVNLKPLGLKAVLALTLASVTNAQFGNTPDNMDDKCMTALVPLTFTDLGTCLCAPDGFKFYSAGDKSMLPYIDSYLDKFCDSSRTPICNEETIDMATSTLAKNCDVRVEEIGNFAAFAYLLLKHYPTLREVMCSRPKGKETWCVTDSFRIAEEHIGHPASLPWFRSLVNWYSDDKNDNKEVKELWSVFDSGKLCTDCMSGFIEHALSIGLVKPDWPVVTDQQAQCGQDFGTLRAVGYFGKNETKVVTPSVIPSVIPMAAAGINGGAGSLLALTGAQLGGLAMAVLASWAW